MYGDDDNLVKITDRQKQIYAPFNPEGKRIDSYPKGKLRVPTEESITAAEQRLGNPNLDKNISAIIDRHVGTDASLADKVTAVRTNPQLRAELGAHFENELAARSSEMPDRLNDSHGKGVKGGYQTDLTSREYASNLALSKLDGSFQPDRGDAIEIYNDGRINGGQPRYAADKLLGFDDSPQHNLDTGEVTTKPRTVITEQGLSPSKVGGVIEGEPWVDMGGGNKLFNVTAEPHVMTAKVNLIDTNGGAIDSLGEAKVLVAHGQPDTNGEWVFKDGSKVADVINKYNQDHPSAPIKAAAVCNPEGVTAEFDVPGVVHASNTTVGVSGFTEDGKLTVDIRLQSSKGGFVMPDRTVVASGSYVPPVGRDDFIAQEAAKEHHARPMVRDPETGEAWSAARDAPRASTASELADKAASLRAKAHAAVDKVAGSGEGASAAERSAGKTWDWVRKPSWVDKPLSSSNLDEHFKRATASYANGETGDGTVSKLVKRVGDSRLGDLSERLAAKSAPVTDHPYGEAGWDWAEKPPMAQRARKAAADLLDGSRSDTIFEKKVGAFSDKVTHSLTDKFGDTKAYKAAQKAGYFKDSEPKSAGAVKTASEPKAPRASEAPAVSEPPAKTAIKSEEAKASKTESRGKVITDESVGVEQPSRADLKVKEAKGTSASHRGGAISDDHPGVDQPSRVGGKTIEPKKSKISVAIDEPGLVRPKKVGLADEPKPKTKRVSLTSDASVGEDVKVAGAVGEAGEASRGASILKGAKTAGRALKTVGKVTGDAYVAGSLAYEAGKETYKDSKNLAHDARHGNAVGVAKDLGSLQAVPATVAADFIKQNVEMAHQAVTTETAGVSKKVSVAGQMVTVGDNHTAADTMKALNTGMGPGWIQTGGHTVGAATKFKRTLYDKHGNPSGTQVVEDGTFEMTQTGSGSPYKSPAKQRQVAAEDKLNHKLFTPSSPGGVAPVEDPLNVLGVKKTDKPKVAGLTKDQTMPDQMTTSQLTSWGWKETSSKDGSTTYIKNGNTLKVDKSGNATYTNNAYGHAIKQHVTVADHTTGGASVGTGMHTPNSAGLRSAQTVHATKTVKVPVAHTVTTYVKVPDQRAITPDSAHDDTMAKVNHGLGLKKQEEQTYHTEKQTKTYYTYETKTVPATYTAPASSAPTSTAPTLPPEASSARPDDWHSHTASDLDTRKTGQTVSVDGKIYNDATVNTFKDGTSTFQENGKTIGYSEGDGASTSVGRSASSPTVTVKLEHQENNQGLSNASNTLSSPDVQDARAHVHPDSYQGGAAVKETSYLKNGDTLTTTASGAQIETTQDGHSYTVKKSPEQKAAEINNGTPSYTDAHDRYAPAYSGGAKPVKVEHLKNGATLTTTASGAVVETTAEGHSYTVKKAPGSVATPPANMAFHDPTYEADAPLASSQPEVPISTPAEATTPNPPSAPAPSTIITPTPPAEDDVNFQRGLVHASAPTPVVDTPPPPLTTDPPDDSIIRAAERQNTAHYLGGHYPSAGNSNPSPPPTSSYQEATQHAASNFVNSFHFSETASQLATKVDLPNPAITLPPTSASTVPAPGLSSLNMTGVADSSINIRRPGVQL